MAKTSAPTSLKLMIRAAEAMFEKTKQTKATHTRRRSFCISFAQCCFIRGYRSTNENGSARRRPRSNFIWLAVSFSLSFFLGRKRAASHSSTPQGAEIGKVRVRGIDRCNEGGKEEQKGFRRAGHGWRRTNHGLIGWARMIPASWDWQKKSKNLASPLAEFLLWFCPIRAANAAVPTQSPGGFSVIPAPP